MERSEVLDALTAGGLPVSPIQSSTVLASLKYNGMSDPAGMEKLGSGLAALLAKHRPTAVLVWEDPLDLLLGYVVARQLSAVVIRAFDADGLVHFAGAFPPKARVVLVADAFWDTQILDALVQLAAQSGGETVALASLFTAPGCIANLPDVPFETLIDFTNWVDNTSSDGVGQGNND